MPIYIFYFQSFYFLKSKKDNDFKGKNRKNQLSLNVNWSLYIHGLIKILSYEKRLQPQIATS